MGASPHSPRSDLHLSFLRPTLPEWTPSVGVGAQALVSASGHKGATHL